jgi:hypothetical protein
MKKLEAENLVSDSLFVSEYLTLFWLRYNLI